MTQTRAAAQTSCDLNHGFRDWECPSGLWKVFNTAHAQNVALPSIHAARWTSLVGEGMERALFQFLLAYPQALCLSCRPEFLGAVGCSYMESPRAVAGCPLQSPILSFITAAAWTAFLPPESLVQPGLRALETRPPPAQSLPCPFLLHTCQKLFKHCCRKGLSFRESVLFLPFLCPPESSVFHPRF